MTVAVYANDEQWKEITGLTANVDWVRMETINAFMADAAAYFILDRIHEFDLSTPAVPVFINSVTGTLHSLLTGANVVRINGWKGFLKNETWETAGDITPAATVVLTALNKKYIPVPDTPGLVSARVIAMIINEAWFALGEKVSTRDEIDIAMKLGTNYPYGPFEWGDMIGIKNILSLLHTLSLTDKRCIPAPLLQKEATLWD